MNKVIRIGTRKSELALWQAKLVLEKIELLGHKTELVLINSEGDIDLIQPLYKMGVVGVFTKTLDIALLNNQIDIAVHSMKDVPVDLPAGITEFAVMERGNTAEVFVKNINNTNTRSIATSSLRRKAQWLNRHPDYVIEELRGNVNTRIQKVEDSKWEGAIFAIAGLERINLLPENHELLDWMIPAPAQGALMIVGREEDKDLKRLVAQLNHEITQQCVTIERQILKILEGGCTAPIAVLASKQGTDFNLRAGIYSLDGNRIVEIERNLPDIELDQIPNHIATLLLKDGGQEILNEIKSFIANAKS